MERRDVDVYLYTYVQVDVHEGYTSEPDEVITGLLINTDDNFAKVMGFTNELNEGANTPYLYNIPLKNIRNIKPL